MMKRIIIPTTELDFYIKYLTIIDGIIKLTPKEIQVLGYFLYYYNKFIKEGYPKKAAMKATFDYETKVKIREHMGEVSSPVVYEKMVRLRKKGIIGGTKGSEFIEDKYLINTTDNLTLEFEFRLHENT